LSHSHIRVQQAPTRRNLWLEAAAGCAFLVLVTALYIASNVLHPLHDLDHLTAEGKVSDTRIVVDHIWDTRYGGRIYYRIEYRIEALVSYEIDGRSYSRWLTGSETTTERALLASKLASSPKSCQVYWLPDRPENARCRFT
jgi:hypothetical protein